MKVTLGGADVSGLWEEVDYGFGSQVNGNPQRPLIAPGKGGARIRGIPQERAALGVSHKGRLLFNAIAQGAIHQGVIEQAQQYGLEGALIPRLANPVTINHESLTDTTLTAGPVFVRDALRVIGAFNADPVPLGDFFFEGTAGQFLGSLAQVAGVVPMVTPSGAAVRMYAPHTPTINNIMTFTHRTHWITDVESVLDQKQVWNQAIVRYRARGNVQQVAVEDMITWTKANAGTKRTEQIQLPNIPNVSYRNVQVAPTNLYAGLGHASIDNIVAGPAASGGVSIALAVQLDGHNVNITATPTGFDGDDPGDWIGSTNTWGTARQPGRVVSITQGLEIIYERVLATVVDSEYVNNYPSQRAWDVRTLDLPTMFRPGARAAIQARLEVLGRPRRIHTLRFPFAQPDDAALDQMLAVAPGAYVDLKLRDETGGNDVDAVCMAIRCDYRLRRSSLSYKKVTFIETGKRITPPVPADSVRWKGKPLGWGRIGDYLEWDT